MFLLYASQQLCLWVRALGRIHDFNNSLKTLPRLISKKNGTIGNKESQPSGPHGGSQQGLPTSFSALSQNNSNSGKLVEDVENNDEEPGTVVLESGASDLVEDGFQVIR